MQVQVLLPAPVELQVACASQPHTPVQEVAPGELVSPSGHEVHDGAFCVLLYVSALHWVHPRSVVSVGVVLT